MPDVGDKGMETANHHVMCVSMQQPCRMCTWTPELKVQFKKKKQKIIFKEKKRNSLKTTQLIETEQPAPEWLSDK